MISQKELIEVLQAHPDHELIFMYPSYEGSDEHYYTMGYASKVLIDEYTVDSNGRVWLRHEDEDEMFNDYCDTIASSMFDKFPLTDEQIEQVEKLTEEEIEKLEWKKAVVVYIRP